MRISAIEPSRKWRRRRRTYKRNRNIC